MSSSGEAGPEAGSAKQASSAEMSRGANISDTHCCHLPTFRLPDEDDLSEQPVESGIATSKEGPPEAVSSNWTCADDDKEPNGSAATGQEQNGETTSCQADAEAVKIEQKPINSGSKRYQATVEDAESSDEDGTVSKPPAPVKKIVTNETGHVDVSVDVNKKAAAMPVHGVQHKRFAELIKKRKIQVVTGAAPTPTEKEHGWPTLLRMPMTAIKLGPTPWWKDFDATFRHAQLPANLSSTKYVAEWDVGTAFDNLDHEVGTYLKRVAHYGRAWDAKITRNRQRPNETLEFVKNVMYHLEVCLQSLLDNRKCVDFVTPEAAKWLQAKKAYFQHFLLYFVRAEGTLLSRYSLSDWTQPGTDQSNPLHNLPFFTTEFDAAIWLYRATIRRLMRDMPVPHEHDSRLAIERLPATLGPSATKDDIAMPVAEAVRGAPMGFHFAKIPTLPGHPSALRIDFPRLVATRAQQRSVTSAEQQRSGGYVSGGRPGCDVPVSEQNYAIDEAYPRLRNIAHQIGLQGVALLTLLEQERAVAGRSNGSAYEINLCSPRVGQIEFCQKTIVAHLDDVGNIFKCLFRLGARVPEQQFYPFLRALGDTWGRVAVQVGVDLALARRSVQARFEAKAGGVPRARAPVRASAAGAAAADRTDAGAGAGAAAGNGTGGKTRTERNREKKERTKAAKKAKKAAAGNGGGGA